MQKRTFLVAAAMLMLASVASFAGGKSEASTAGKVETVAIEHWTHWLTNNPFYEPYWEKAAQKFTASRKDVDFKIKVVGVPYEGYEAKYASAFAAKMGPGMFNEMSHSAVGQYGVADLMPQDIADKMEKLLIGAAKPYGFVDGKRYGLPVEGGNFMMMYINIDMFKEAGLNPAVPPKTLDEMLEFAKKLTKYDAAGKVKQAGFAIRYKGHPFGVADKVAPFFNAYGADWMNWNERKASGYLNSPASIEAMTYYGDLVNKYKVSSLELDNPDAIFGQGLAAITFRESWYSAWLKGNAPNVKYLVYPLPRQKMEAGFGNNFPWAINVNKDIKDVDRKWLWEFFRWYVNSPEIRKEHYLGSKMLPSYNDIIDDPFFKSLPEFEAWKTTAAGRAAPTYYIPPAQEVLKTIGDAVLTVLYNKESPKAALDTAAKKVDDILGRYKK